MQTKAVFENIPKHKQQETSKAHKAIVIVVAWFTNKNIFNFFHQSEGKKLNL